MTIKLILILIGIVAGCSVIGIIVFKLERAKKDRAENKILKKNEEKATKVEIKKTEIREDHNEKANDIINNPGDNHNVMPDGVSRKHNHSFRDPCTSDCPAYDK